MENKKYTVTKVKEKGALSDEELGAVNGGVVYGDTQNKTYYRLVCPVCGWRSELYDNTGANGAEDFWIAYCSSHPQSCTNMSMEEYII